MSTLLLQLILCAVTIIQLTSSQRTCGVTQQANAVSSCCAGSGQIEQVLRQLMNAVSQLQRDVGDMKTSMSQLERDVTELRARDAKGKLRNRKSPNPMSQLL